MKTLVRLIAGMAALLALSPMDAHGQGYVFFNGGGGGPAHAGSGGVESGAFLPKSNPRFLVGGAFSVTNNGYPEQQITPFLQTHVRDEQELSLVAGIRLARGVYAVGTGGMSDRARRDYFTVSGNKDLLGEYGGTIRGVGSGQLRFVYKRAMFGVGYHSRRGIIVGFGFTFSRLRPGRK